MDKAEYGKMPGLNLKLLDNLLETIKDIVSMQVGDIYEIKLKDKTIKLHRIE